MSLGGINLILSPALMLISELGHRGTYINDLAAFDVVETILPKGKHYLSISTDLCKQLVHESSPLWNCFLSSFLAVLVWTHPKTLIRNTQNNQTNQTRETNTLSLNNKIYTTVDCILKFIAREGLKKIIIICLMMKYFHTLLLKKYFNTFIREK